MCFFSVVRFAGRALAEFRSVVTIRSYAAEMSFLVTSEAGFDVVTDVAAGLDAALAFFGGDLIIAALGLSAVGGSIFGDVAGVEGCGAAAGVLDAG